MLPFIEICKFVIVIGQVKPIRFYLLFSHAHKHEKEVARNKGNTNGIRIYTFHYKYHSSVPQCAEKVVQSSCILCVHRFAHSFSSNAMLIKKKQKKAKRMEFRNVMSRNRRFSTHFHSHSSSMLISFICKFALPSSSSSSW